MIMPVSPHPPPIAWRPSAGLDALRRRARLLADIRAWFAAEGLLEVDTPLMAAAASVDRHIESFEVPGGSSAGAGWLQSSPEFHMKRLLAAGSGPIYQLAHVFRREERGRHHHVEFMLAEWYRPGWDDARLIDDVFALMAHCGAPTGGERLSYQEAFLRHAGVDPFADVAALQRVAREAGLAPAQLAAEDAADIDFWRDLLMSLVVQPQLGRDAPCAVTDFPASQAALARLRAHDPRCAGRFEIYWRGVELANGYDELVDAAEQRRRFEADLDWRRRQGRVLPPMDEALLAAMAAGLPACAGVALGVDRLLMLLLGAGSLDEVVAFGAG